MPPFCRFKSELLGVSLYGKRFCDAYSFMRRSGISRLGALLCLSNSYIRYSTHLLSSIKVEPRLKNSRLIFRIAHLTLSKNQPENLGLRAALIQLTLLSLPLSLNIRKSVLAGEVDSALLIDLHYLYDDLVAD